MTRWSLIDSFVSCVFQGHHHQETSDSTSLPMCASSIRWRLLLWKLTRAETKHIMKCYTWRLASYCSVVIHDDSSFLCNILVYA